MKTKLITILSSVLILSACGGGGGGSDGGNSSYQDIPAPDSEIISYITKSNIDFFPGLNGRPAGTWRWAAPASINVYVPLPINVTEQDYQTKVRNSIATINAKLIGDLTLTEVNTVPVAGNYISVSYNTSYVPNGSTDYASYCANVSEAPNQSGFIFPDANGDIDKVNAIGTKPVYLNIGNGHCNVTQAIVTHEFGHTLGLAYHFPDFGDAPLFKDALFDVLATLYGNPKSTIAANLVVKRSR